MNKTEGSFMEKINKNKFWQDQTRKKHNDRQYNNYCYSHYFGYEVSFYFFIKYP